MALTAAQALVNTTADAYLAAIDALLSGLTAGDKVMLVPIRENPGAASTATDPVAGRMTTITLTVAQTTNNASNRFAIGGDLIGQVLGFVPLCMKVTNTAGDLTA